MCLFVNFINFLLAAFVHADPKSAKNTVKPSVFFALPGSASAQATCRMLMKLTLSVSMVTVLTLFGCQGFIDSFRQLWPLSNDKN
jgi:hypothetical protein